MQPFDPIISDDLLTTNAFFDLYPFDGGGCFITHNIAGSNTDAGIVHAVLHKGALDEWGCLPYLDFPRFERWRTVEKSCWLNRFYFIVPLAKYARQYRDAKIAELVLATMRHFIDVCLPPNGLDDIRRNRERIDYLRNSVYNNQKRETWEQDETDIGYIWYDFQPAGRILHFIYVLHFLQDFVTDRDRSLIVRSLHDHAQLLLLEERHCACLATGNHQSLRAMGLLYAAAYFRGEPEAVDYLHEGLRITNYHAENDWFEDGVLKEISPSYHIFESWHLRDAWLLSRKYDFDLGPRISERLANAVRFIRSIRQPDGTSVAIGDGYPVNLDAYLASFSSDFGDIGLTGKTVRFPHAGFGVYRDNRTYCLLDASTFCGEFSHYHGGKNSLVLWHNGQPFFADCGCCSYDDPHFSECKSAANHGSLLVDGQGDSTLEGTYHWTAWACPVCEPWQDVQDTSCITGILTSNARCWEGVTWRRTVQIEECGMMTIVDDIDVQRQAILTFVFSLHPDVIVERCDGGFMLRNGDVGLKILCKNPANYSTQESSSYLTFSNRTTRLLKFQLATIEKATAIVFKIIPSPVGKISAQQNRSANGLW